MPHNKEVNQYASGKKGINTVHKNSNFDVTTNVQELKHNSTAVAQLYTAKIPSIASRVKATNNIFIGTKQYVVNKNVSNIDIHANYMQSVFNNTYGYLNASTIHNLETLYKFKVNVLVHMFMSILMYNNILYYTNIKVYETMDETILGEPFTYILDHNTSTLKLFISLNTLNLLLENQKDYSINFSNEIINSACNANSTHSLIKKNFIHSISDIQQLLMKFFIIVDHAATHFIEEYIHNTTDWVNHFKFGQTIAGYTTSHSVFKITAHIQNTVMSPKIIVTNFQSSTDDSLDKLFKLPNSILPNISPISAINSDFTTLLNTTF